MKTKNNQLLEDQDFVLWVQLRQARDAVFKAREKELSQYGISVMQSAILLHIKILGEKATIGEISRWVLREPNTVSVNLSRMEKQGLVIKGKSRSGKKSIVYITLTDKGEQALKQSLKRESIRDIMSCLSSEEERKQLSSSLIKLRNKALKGLMPISELPPFP